MKTTTAVIRKLRCPYCRYVWEPKKKYPKSCPDCKRRLGWLKNGKIARRS